MTQSPNRPVTQRTWVRILAALIAITAVTTMAGFLTTPRAGGQLDPEATTPAGAHALVALLRDRGVTVVVAKNTDDAVRASTPDSTLVFGQSRNVASSALLGRLARAPGDLLLVDPTPRVRAAMSPMVRNAAGSGSDDTAGCALPAAERAGPVDFGSTSTFRTVGGTAATSCYGGALIRYRDRDRTVTVVGSSDFLTNGGLLRAGNAALAMNLAGERSRVVWFAPQRVEGGGSGKGRITDLIPPGVRWMVAELCLTVALLALWKGRRLGPLVVDDLPVVVRASETVEGHGRLYRSRRARDRAAHALRAATTLRLTSRVGLGPSVTPPTLVAAIATRTRLNPDLLRHVLFGAPPRTEEELVQLARALDDIERQVTLL